jgi:hypothetical protein
MSEFRRRLTYSNVMASVAVFVSLGGGAYAATAIPSNSVDSAAIKNGAVTSRKLAAGSVTAAKIAPGSLTGAQINTTDLGTVPDAAHANVADSATNAATAADATDATHADNASNATNATNAGNASLLDGLAASAFQSPVAGFCTNGSAIAQINPDGSVACSGTQAYAGRITAPTFSGADRSNTYPLLTIPGVAHLDVWTCTNSDTSVQILNDNVGTVDSWTVDGSGISHDGTTWADSITGSASSGGITWELGTGSGPGAVVIQVTVFYAITGTGSCVAQASAQVITATG